jgi:eukaryotic-like serine/threonine-protein kinase
MAPMTGRVVAGRYILEELIGHGGMGQVWRAHDRLLNRKVALKEVLLPPAPIDEGEAAVHQRTLREARAVARLNHPNIVTIYDVAEEDGRLWIIMELVPSGSLEQRLAAHGPMTALRAARLGQQLLSALAAVHAAGVLHRDVKPNNVLIAPGGPGNGPDDRAVLTDFGIARSEGDTQLTQANVVMGSVGYTAPERLNGLDATSASDLWSLGATLYAAVEGHGPYQRDTQSGTLVANAQAAPQPAPSAGRLAPLIEALLRREPDTRPSAPAAARMLDEILRRMPDETAPASFVAVPSPGMIPAESVHHEITEPAQRAEPEQHQAVLPGRTWPAPPGERTQTSSIQSPASHQSPAPHQSPAARDLFQQLAPESGGGSPPSARRDGARGPAGRGGKAALAAAAIVVIAGIVAGGFFLLKPRSIHDTPQANSTATGSPSPSATGLQITHNAKLVKAIDTPSDALPPGYQTERFLAADLGTAAGFSIAMPESWHVGNSVGRKIYLDAPDGTTYVAIDLTADVKRNMVDEADYLRSQHDYPGYLAQGDLIAAEPIRGTAGAFWRFDWKGSGGQMRMDVLLFTLGSQSFTIYANGLAGPNDNNWNTNLLPIVDTMMHTFKQLPA